MKTITTTQTRELIEKKTGKRYTHSHICLLCRSGFLKAEKIGRDWAVDFSSANKFKPGIPGAKKVSK